VVYVAVFDRIGIVEVDAQRRSEKLRLDVVHGKRIAGEERVDVARTDQRG
jgi:hypothetical protein